MLAKEPWPWHAIQFDLNIRYLYRIGNDCLRSFFSFVATRFRSYYCFRLLNVFIFQKQLLEMFVRLGSI